MATERVAAGRASGGSQTLERGLRVLKVLAEHTDGLSVSELAEAMRTHRAGIYRLLGPLSDERLVVRGVDGRFTLGLGLLELASNVRPHLQEAATRELRSLADELQATTALTVRDGDEAVVLAVVEPRGTTWHLAYRPGLRHRLSVAAPGLAILAAGPPIPGERPEIAIVRERGYACTTGELLAGATGVAAPVAVSGQETGASISAVWIEPRDEAEAGAAVIRSARAIAAAL